MKLRIIILILALFAFVSASAGGILYYYSFRNAAFEKAESDADAHIEQLTRQLSTFLSEHVKTARTLAGLEKNKACADNHQSGFHLPGKPGDG